MFCQKGPVLHLLGGRGYLKAPTLHLFRGMLDQKGPAFSLLGGSGYLKGPTLHLLGGGVPPDIEISGQNECSKK